MHDDDAPIGRVLDRREALRLLGAAGVAAFVACARGADNAAEGTAIPAGAPSATALPGCVVRPEKTEGPFFRDEKLNRSDIRTDPSNNIAKPGVPLEIAFVVSRVSSGRCIALPGAILDVWHCDALGRYSDVANGIGQPDTSGSKFLRGYQLTNASGQALFTTIYPGWYQGRAVHIHFKIRVGSYDFTSQLFFDAQTTETVLSKAPYSERGQPDTTNATDSIYEADGRQLLLDLKTSGDGYAATFPIGLQL